VSPLVRRHVTQQAAHARTLRRSKFRQSFGSPCPACVGARHRDAISHLVDPVAGGLRTTGAQSVCVSVIRQGSHFRLAFDDCVRRRDGDWCPARFLTHLDVTAREFRQLALNTEQLADIGLTVVTRLRALAAPDGGTPSRKGMPRRAPSAARRRTRQGGPR
jgi:hypothetical protein